ncbi:P1 family peptidase, partial [Methylobacterium haplocladii]
AFGRVTVGQGPQFWAAPFERSSEFGGLGFPAAMPADAFTWPREALLGTNTTLAVIATDAALTKAEAKRLAVAAQDGLARAIHPVHTPLDGDVVFSVSTGRLPLADTVGDLARIGAAAADVLARAVAIGVFSATRLPCLDLPAWRELYASPSGKAT